MRIFAAIVMLAGVLGASAQSQELTARWDAGEAFVDAGLLESYLPMDGVSWLLNARIELTFRQGVSDYRPQSIFRPEPNAWMCFGNELRLRCDSVYEIREVKIRTLRDFPFLQGEARVSEGTLECSGNTATWVHSGSANLLVFSQPGPYEEIHAPGGRVAITSVEVTYGPYTSAITELATGQNEAPEVFDLQGRAVAAPRKGGIYIVNRRLRRL